MARNGKTAEEPTPVETALVPLQQLEDLGKDTMFSSVFDSIRGSVKGIFEDTLNDLQNGVVSDFKQAILDKMKPVFKLISMIPNKALRETAKNKLNNIINDITESIKH
jgi:hypothetical protein